MFPTVGWVNKPPYVILLIIKTLCHLWLNRFFPWIHFSSFNSYQFHLVLRIRRCILLLHLTYPLRIHGIWSKLLLTHPNIFWTVFLQRLFAFLNSQVSVSLFDAWYQALLQKLFLLDILFSEWRKWSTLDHHCGIWGFVVIAIGILVWNLTFRLLLIFLLCLFKRRKFISRGWWNTTTMRIVNTVVQIHSILKQFFLILQILLLERLQLFL